MDRMEPQNPRIEDGTAISTQQLFITVVRSLSSRLNLLWPSRSPDYASVEDSGRNKPVHDMPWTRFFCDSIWKS